ncbi:MAG: molybdate ABC transporter substrate-binding protein [Rickettsiales bacterium]
MPRFLAFIALFFIALPAFAQPAPKAAAKANLTVLTDEAMLLPLARLARQYAVETKTPLTIVVKNTQDAEEQIEQGLEAHVIISANYPLISRLTEQGLTDVSSRRAIARTQLALVTASDLGKQASIARRISFASILAATPDWPVIAVDGSTMEGELVDKLLTNHEFSTMLATRMARRPNHEEVIASLRDEPSLGIILAASAVVEPDVRVVSLLTNDISAPVTFDAVVLGSESMADARAFTNYLFTRKAQLTLSHFGFQPPK